MGRVMECTLRWICLQSTTSSTTKAIWRVRSVEQRRRWTLILQGIAFFVVVSSKDMAVEIIAIIWINKLIWITAF
jgi:hypothetical protein